METAFVDMKIPVVEKMANQLQTMGDVLKKVAMVLEVLVGILAGTAFMGLVGGLAQAHYMDVLAKKIQATATKCETLSREVHKAVEDFKQANTAGAAGFGD